MNYDLKGIQYLRAKLATKKNWVQIRYDYYESKNTKLDPSPVIPRKEAFLYSSKLGWCAKAVDSLANRLSFDGFDNDRINMWNVFQMNNADILFDSAIRSALISACCFIYISPDKNGFPRLQVIDGYNATGIIDPITYLLKEGYAVLESDEQGNPLIEAYFTSEYTDYYYVGAEPRRIANPTGYPLLVPVIYRPDAKRPFGQSRISPDCMDLQDKARFCITRAEIAAEFGSFPQKYVVGLSQDAEFDVVANAYKQFLAIDKDEDGGAPSVGQFTQANIEQHLKQLEAYAKAFAGATGLTIDDLGFVSDNPSSAEAIRAGHSNLEHIATKAQETFGTGFLNVGFVSCCLRDNAHLTRQEVYNMTPVWKPLFSLDNSAISSFGDGIIKIGQAIPEVVTPKLVKRMTGLPIEIEE